MDYSKYPRYRKTEPNLTESAQEFTICLNDQKLDEIDIRRILIDMKVPFNFKNHNSIDSKIPSKNGQLAVFLKGNSDQIKELKLKINERGFHVNEAKGNFKKSTHFTTDKIMTENCVNLFVADKKDVGEVTASLQNKKNELQTEMARKIKAEQILGIVG